MIPADAMEAIVVVVGSVAISVIALATGAPTALHVIRDLSRLDLTFLRLKLPKQPLLTRCQI